MKWLPVLLVAAGVCLKTMPALATIGHETVDGVEYKFSVSEVSYDTYEATIVGSQANNQIKPAIPISTAGDITIPSRLGGFPVKHIGKYAFFCCRDLTSVTIPEGVTSIGEGAFQGCSGLVNVTIPDSVTAVEDHWAFSECPLLYDTTTIPGVKLVDGWAVGHEDSLSGVLNLTGVRGIAPLAFEDCTGLTRVTIPDSVKSLEQYAFQGCRCITSVIIGNGVPTIGNNAFAGCRKLESVTIGNGVATIGPEAFYGCGRLTSVTIPNSVTVIGGDAFKDCFGLTSVTIPDSVTRIESYAFAGCSGLVNVTIPDSVTRIESSAFEHCTGLTSVRIGNGVTWIGSCTFNGCASLKALYLPTSWKQEIPYPMSEVGELNYAGGILIYIALPFSCRVAYLEYTVKFNPNGGKGKMSAQKMTCDEAAKLCKSAFSRKGYVFAGWAVSKSDAKKGVVAFKNAQKVKNLSTVGKKTTLYAVWAKPTYKVKFVANGGKGKMAVQKMTYGKAKKLSANKFKRNGYAFKGWATSKANARKGKVAYKNKKKVKNLVTNGKTVKLYAVWKKK